MTPYIYIYIYIYLFFKVSNCLVISNFFYRFLVKSVITGS